MALEVSPGVILTPTPTKTMTPTNYISDSQYNLLSQYLPELEKGIHDRFGSQMITGMCESLGKESPFTADLIKWTEEGRLTQLAESVTRSSNDFTSTAHTFRVGETIVARSSDGGVIRKGRISAVTADTFTVVCGHASGWTALGTTGITVYADSSEFGKGTEGMSASLNSQVEQFTNTPVRISEKLTENRTNLALQTWVDTGEGYLWYFKNLADTKLRFNNKIENKMMLGEQWAGALASAGFQGTQGLLSCAEEGNINGGPIADLDDVDAIIDRLNAQGMISEYYMYNTSAQNRLIDRFLKAENVTGSSWGAFNNDKDLALNLGFKEFNYGNYNFYKSNWRFLDSPTGEGSATGATKYHGLMLPSGSKKVYDVMTGTSATQPYLHVRYRASSQVNKKYEMSIRDWAQGTSSTDERIIELQTERVLQCMGRNNLVLLRG